ncbi:MAG: 7TM diverse intracellular signaling domain-containing protein [Spirochaetota bacterium]
MKQLVLLLITIATFFLLIVPLYSVEAVYDMQTFNFDNATTYKIKSHWLFWWNELVDPVAIEKGTAPKPTDSVMMPQHWTDYVLDGKKLPAKGYATYALKILLPDNAIYGMYLDHMVTAYRLYINGIEVASNGKVSKDLLKMENECKHQAIYFTPKDKVAMCVVHISNRDYRTAGMWQPIVIGKASAILTHYNTKIIRDLFLFGAILIIGLYNIALFLFRTKDRAPLWFGLFCLTVCARILATGSTTISNMFPGFPWELQIKMELGVFYLGGLFFGMFFHEVYPLEIKMKHLRFFNAVFIILTLLAIITPVSFFNRLVPLMQVAVLSGLTYVLVCLIIAAKRKRLHINYFLAGFVLFMLAAINDILYAQNILPTLYVLPIGLFIFIFTQAIAIARIFSFSFLQVEHLSTHLSNLNQSLERFVPHEFLAFLQKQSILDVQLGDQTLKDITVLFADIRSFTTLSENMTPEETFKFLNSYLNRIGPIIRSHNGFIDKYIGDGIMALFPQSPKDAIDATIAMVQRIQQYNEERVRFGLEPISIGIGIHTGSAILGIIGETMRIESTVISDTVNLSSRIESLTKHFHTTILVSGDVYQQVKDIPGYHFRYISKVIVKGKSQPTKIYEVLSLYPQESLELFTSTALMFRKALSFYNKKHYDQAKALFEEILTINPHDIIAKNFIQDIEEEKNTGRV